MTKRHSHPEKKLICEVLIAAGIEKRRPDELAFVYLTFCRRLPEGLSRGEIESEFRRQRPGLCLEAGRDDRRYYAHHRSLEAIFEDSNTEDEEWN